MLESEPRSIIIPASSEALPLAPFANSINLSVIVVFVELTVVVVPLIVRLPVTVKSPVITALVETVRPPVIANEPPAGAKPLLESTYVLTAA